MSMVSGMVDLSRDEKAKHFLPRWLRDAFATDNEHDFEAKIGLFQSIHATPKAEPCAPESPTMHLRESIH